MHHDTDTLWYRASQALQRVVVDFERRPKNTTTVLDNDPTRWIDRWYHPGLTMLDPNEIPELLHTNQHKRARNQKETAIKDDPETSCSDSKRRRAYHSDQNADFSAMAVSSQTTDQGELDLEQLKTCIKFNDELVNLASFLAGSTFGAHMDSLRDIKATPVFGLRSELMPYQAVGKDKLCLLAQSGFKVGFLCDAVGLGKSLTAILAAIEVRKKLPRPGFNLIDTRPTFIILDSVDIPVAELLKYDFVICTKHFLRKRFQDMQDFTDFSSTANSFSVKESSKYHKKATKFHRAPLQSQLYAKLGNEIAVLIIDESHDYKNENSFLNAAVRSLKYHHAFLLTGTPLYNTWHDLAGQAALLPGGGPFINLDHCVRLFSCEVNNRETDHPRGVKLERLKALVMGMMIARPKNLLQLPGIERNKVLVDFTGNWKSVFMIARYVDKAKSFLGSSKGAGGTGRAGTAKKSGFAMFVKAQQLAANPLLLTSNECDDQWDRTKPKVDKILDLANSHFTSFLKKRGLGLDLGMDDLTAMQFEDFQMYYRENRRRSSQAQPHGATELVASGETSGADEDGAGDAVNETSQGELNDEFDDQDFLLGAETAYREEGFVYAEDEEDDTYVPGQVERRPSVVSGQQGESSDSDSFAGRRHRRKGRADPKFTERWLSKLSNATYSEIFSPRVRAIIDQIGHICTVYPDEKIIVVSTFVMFLDILKEAIRREAQTNALFTFDVCEYNGSIKSSEARSSCIRTFNAPSNCLRVLLMSATAGGTGLNIIGASHIIISEPFWTPGERVQVEGRPYRLGQKRVVHCWDMVGDLSSIDVTLRSSAKWKSAFNATMNDHLVRNDVDHLIGMGVTRASDVAGSSL
ncbi:hypothetical protein AK830_g9629 [Neonectria ditissima]|uniref:Helicase C-terminal domain-containing protein n=1 Tax=Neonectria ditissima TaxID=78410 RepID=A0A0P7AHM2_9HYPO|nr:hypothetical protein AK830_g9629 [Neonectria ditissima]